MPVPIPASLPLLRTGFCRGLVLTALTAALLTGLLPRAVAQTPVARPDSVVVPSLTAAPDTVRAVVVPAELPPDADPAPAPVSRQARWTILGACALLTLSTLLLYNVRSR